MIFNFIYLCQKEPTNLKIDKEKKNTAFEKEWQQKQGETF